MTGQRQWIKRFTVFLVGTFLLGLGVAFSTRSGLGTTPISSVPYVLSLAFPLSFGTWTFLFNIFFVLAQIAILRRTYDWRQVSQLAAVFVLGVFIDIGMVVSRCYVATDYVGQIGELLLGSCLIAVGVSCQIIANICYIPGDGLVFVMSTAWAVPFGKVKLVFDTVLVLLALVLALLMFGKPAGLREGTLFAACFVGPLIHMLAPQLRRMLGTTV